MGVPAAGRGGRDPLPRPLRGGMAGAAGGFPAVAGGVCVLRAVGCSGSAPAGSRSAAGAAAGGAGRAELPTAAVIDSQSVKAADTVGAATSGFDGGKKIKGRKRHVAVDSNGWLLAVLVTAGSVQDRDGGHRLVALLRERFSTITLVWADGGYAGRLVAWAAAVLAVTVTVVKRSDNLRGFVVLPRRWVVERSFGWLNRHRRLVRDYERLPEHHEAMLLWATTVIMTRQLVRDNIAVLTAAIAAIPGSYRRRVHPGRPASSAGSRSFGEADGAPAAHTVHDDWDGHGRSRPGGTSRRRSGRR